MRSTLHRENSGYWVRGPHDTSLFTILSWTSYLSEILVVKVTVVIAQKDSKHHLRTSSGECRGPPSVLGGLADRLSRSIGQPNTAGLSLDVDRILFRSKIAMS